MSQRVGQYVRADQPLGLEVLREAAARLGWTEVSVYSETWLWVEWSVPDPVTAAPRWRVTAAVWNVRSEPSTARGLATITGQLRQGEVVNQLEEANGWIRHDGGGGGAAGWSAGRGMAKVDG